MLALPTPVVMNIHKKKGKRPSFDVYIGRAVKGTEFTEDSKWANPFYASSYSNPNDCLVDYERYMRNKVRSFPAVYDLSGLTGKRLGCWCKPAPCHGDMLVKLWKEWYYKK